MTEHNMNHLNYIRVVVEADLAYVDRKDRQYGGSWKRRGGVGAFMMLARKWDRLEQFMAKFHYDIFGVIDAEIAREKSEAESRTPAGYTPDYDVGKDGTVLAEVRDLRRYLMLVEAEMMARGVVPGDRVFGVATAGGKKGEPVDVLREGTTEIRKSFVGGDGQVIRELDPVWVMPDPGELHSTRNKPEAAVARRLERNGEVTVDYATGESQIVKHGRLSRRATVIRELDVNGPVIMNGMVHEHGRSPRVATAEDLALAERTFTTDRRVPRYEPDTPDEDNIACRDAPFVVPESYWRRKNIERDAFDKFWTLRAPDVHVLDAHVVSDSIPGLLRNYYHSRGGEWIIDIDRVPASVRGHFPALRGEVNMKEHEELPEWQRVLYTWDANGTKFRLAQLGWGGGL
jgi:hypothetical protein